MFSHEFPSCSTGENGPATRFASRRAAGRVLAAQLASYAGRDDVLVLGLPRGGVPVAAEVAAALHAPIDVWLVRKLGVPGQEEFAMGAIASDGVVELDQRVIDELDISREALVDVIRRERSELDRRARAYRGNRAAPRVAGRTVVLVDDGLATGSTMRAAVRALRLHSPREIVVAVPVASREACAELGRVADRCVCAQQPEPFRAVGRWYDDFEPTSDEEVLLCLHRARKRPTATETNEK